MKKQTQAKLFKVFELLLFILITAFGIIVLSFGFKMLYEASKIIF